MPNSSIQPSDDQLFAELRKIDTPTITNVVATYPKNPLCLGLYNPWTENWYTDTSIRCIYPEMGAIVGYAVTCVYGLPDPNYAGRLSFMDVVDALDAMKKPTILVIQQKWPPELQNKAGLAGEMMVSSMMAVGCVGMLSNGPSRDVDAIRKLHFQLLLGGVTAGHGEMAVQSVNVPVSVGGMDVAPGDLIHMDENGAVKFPPKHAPAIVKNAQAMLEDEARRLVLLRKAKTAAEVRAAIVRRRLYAEEGLGPNRPRSEGDEKAQLCRTCHASTVNLRGHKRITQHEPRRDIFSCAGSLLRWRSASGFRQGLYPVRSGSVVVLLKARLHVVRLRVLTGVAPR